MLVYRECPECHVATNDDDWEPLSYLEGVRPLTIHTYRCPSCGKEIDGSDTTIEVD